MNKNERNDFLLLEIKYFVAVVGATPTNNTHKTVVFRGADPQKYSFRRRINDLHKSSVLVFVHCGSLEVLSHVSTALSHVSTALAHMLTEHFAHVNSTCRTCRQHCRTCRQHCRTCGQHCRTCRQRCRTC
jgi:hypothetical protein